MGLLSFRKGASVQTTSADLDAISTGVDHGVGDASIEKVQMDLKSFQREHLWDPNMPQENLDAVGKALRTGDVEAEMALESELVEEDSPYAEVRAAVRSEHNPYLPSDAEMPMLIPRSDYDEEAPANTIRAWVIGMLWTTIGSAINMLFSLRNPSIYLTPVVTLLLSYPAGVAWAAVMPTRKFKTFGLTWSLNPGPFNMKEHAVIVIMANASFGGTTAYSTDVLLAQEVFYKQKFGWGYQLLLTITCQMLGLGLAGLSKRWLVDPAAMIWPSNLVTTTLFETIHTKSTPDAVKTSGWKMGRYKWFLIVMGAIFVWEWFPLWIAPMFATFTFVCWAAPNNVVVNQLFGGQSGLSLLPITFDWSTITAFINSPLVYPFHAIANTTVGLVIFVIITSIGIHYTGSLYSEYLPMSTSGSFDNTGSSYNVSKILNPDFTLNEEKYKEYSPLFLSTTFALTYGLSFATITALVVHTGLFNGPQIWQRFRASREDGADVHMRMMMKYEDAPTWWYGLSFIVMFALGLVTCLVWETHLTWWGFIVALLISVFFYLPVGIVQATTNVQLGLNVITEFIIGYMLPGRPLAMMMFKMYVSIPCSFSPLFEEPHCF